MSPRFHAPYPQWNVLDKWESPSFNDLTRAALHRRLTEVPARRFFAPGEWRTVQALCDVVMPQDDNPQPVPLAAWIDAALHEGRSSGTRHADMPSPPDAWRQGIAALDAEAQARGAAGFASLERDAQNAMLRDVDDGKVSAEHWQGLPPQRFFRSLVLAEIVAVYYAHPTGQSEIGYGGPASPRGYVRMQPNRADSWEAPPGDWPDEHTP